MCFARDSRRQRLRVRVSDGADEPQTRAHAGNGFYDAGRQILLCEFAAGKRSSAGGRPGQWARPGDRRTKIARETRPGIQAGRSADQRSAQEKEKEGMTTAILEAAKLTDRINRIEPSATMAVVAEADKLRSQGIDVVDFGAGEPHFSTPQHIKDAAIAAIQGNFTKYTAVAGTAELRDAIAHRHNVDFDSDYRREQVIASVGGKHALFNAIQVLVDHGDEVILPVPYWVSFKDIVRYAGGNCVFLEADEADGFRVTAKMVARLITPRTKVIILNSPSNPSGAVMKPEDMTEVVRLAHQRGIWVLSDECYVNLNYTAKNFSVGSLRQYKERFVVLGSLSKTYAMTGWRLGYAMAPAVVTGAMAKLQSQC